MDLNRIEQYAIGTGSTELAAANAAFLLRISLGAMLLAHSVWLKGVVFTLAGTAGYFESIGLPGMLAYLIFALEACGGLMLLLGVRTRQVSLVMIPVLLGATWAHSANGWLFSNEGGGWEYPLFLTIAFVVQALLGDGRYALSLRTEPQQLPA